ncbi:hypothetical protein EG329_013545 [Mollisiaceae sp. DMI_Dod_QoI]|nr:hypothetical protein EG329_013545 [Helotiales sp. DMI_Dod_QoI]
MPPRLKIPQNRWSTFELPILPFLAPRVFEPWPFEHRTYWPGRQVKTKLKGIRHLTDFRPTQQTSGHGQLSKNPAPNAVPVKGFTPSKEVESQSWHSQTKPWDSRPYYDQEMDSTRVELVHLKHENSEDEEFLGKHEKIRCSPVDKHPPKAKATKNSRLITLYRVRRRNHNPSINVFGKSSLDPTRARAHKHWLKERKHRQAIARRNIRLRIKSEATLRFGIPWTRPRSISLPLNTRYKFPWPYSQWNTRFGFLNLRNEKFMEGKEIPSELMYHALRATFYLPEKLQKALSKHTSTTSFRQDWAELDRCTRASMWPAFMMTALEKYPDKALNILEATYRSTYPPAFAVSNCLEYIISHRLKSNTPDGPGNIVQFARRIRGFLYLGAQEKITLPQDSINRLLSHLRAPEILRLYTTLDQIKHPLHENTLLHFASRLGSAGFRGTEAALAVLQRMKDLGCNLNTPKTLSVFSTMLKRTDRETNARQLDSRILKFMMDSSISPNIITYNVLLQNSMRDGEFETGWNIYEMMLENGIEPDAFTYSSLLNDAKIRMDAEAIKRVIRIVRDKRIKNHHIVTDILHAIFSLHLSRKHNFLQPSYGYEKRNKSALDSMLQVYCEHFQIGPLLCLIPGLRARYSSVIDTMMSSQYSRQVPLPREATLVVMISAYLVDLQSSMSVKNFYEHFNKLLITRNPIAIELSKTVYTWNVIIMNFGRFSDGLADCPQIVGNMLSHISRPAAVEDEETSQFHRHPLQDRGSTHLAPCNPKTPAITKPKGVSDSEEAPQNSEDVGPHSNYANPDVYTWSILLKIFMDHQQPRAAERALEMMKERGVEPNQVTWNTLIGGYAKMQMTLDTVGALRRMEDAGFKANEVTLKALSKLRDKRTMLSAMQMNERLRAQASNHQEEDLTQEFSENGEDAYHDDDLIRQWSSGDRGQECYTASKGKE